MQADEYLFEDLTVAGGKGAGFDLRVPHRGIIYRLTIVQTSGDLAGFTYTLYNDPAACPLGEVAAPADAAAHLFSIAGPCVVEATKAYFVPDESACNGVHCLFLPYMTRDALGVSGGRHYHLRLRIDAAGTGAKTFAAALTLSQGEFA